MGDAGETSSPVDLQAQIQAASQAVQESAKAVKELRTKLLADDPDIRALQEQVEAAQSAFDAYLEDLPVVKEMRESVAQLQTELAELSKPEFRGKPETLEKSREVRQKILRTSRSLAQLQKGMNVHDKVCACPTCGERDEASSKPIFEPEVVRLKGEVLLAEKALREAFWKHEGMAETLKKHNDLMNVYQRLAVSRTPVVPDHIQNAESTGSGDSP